ncbi:hypothetical protein HMPREF3190_01486 [Umbribacter vaginalis]|nr:hypothetical protein HMPREF3190_01486 [Coriobacteriales bacterium DNF00809]
MFLLFKYKYTEFRGRYLGELHNSTKRIDAMRAWVCTCLRYTGCSACITSVVRRLCNRCVGACVCVCLWCTLHRESAAFTCVFICKKKGKW